MDDFILYALAAGIGIALAAGPLGCLVVWQRLAFLGDTLAHSALLGVAISLLLQLPITLGIAVLSVVLALVLSLRRLQRLPPDTLLGVFSPTALALGMILVSQTPTARMDMHSLLFGDILTVTQVDLWPIYGMAALVLAVVRWHWQGLVAMALHPALASAEGVPVERLRLLLTLLLAGFVAVAMQMVGILLTTALLVLPAAIARLTSRTPGEMASVATMAGVMSVGLGVGASLEFNIPTGPAIVVAAGGLLLAVFFLSYKSRIAA
jgi:zinc transport system permease protein